MKSGRISKRLLPPWKIGKLVNRRLTLVLVVHGSLKPSKELRKVTILELMAKSKLLKNRISSG